MFSQLIEGGANKQAMVHLCEACKCGRHCGQSCQDCENCPDCQCAECKEE